MSIRRRSRTKQAKALRTHGGKSCVTLEQIMLEVKERLLNLLYVYH
ncbi:MAG: hypothetical protein K9W44_04585 [Candidatus Lokiarchaeota archaeon]|nr:hypothetical protein [Candidatus Harpocratesius repetitus]